MENECNNQIFIPRSSPHFMSQNIACIIIHTDICSSGAKYCRQYLNKDGVCIFVHNNWSFKNIDWNEFSNDQDIKACAVTLYNSCNLSTYTPPTRKFALF